MLISAHILKLLEEGDEDTKANRIKTELHLNSDRAARVILNILENNPERWEEKLVKEIKKLEEKKLKEYKKMQKKMESYNMQFQNEDNRMHKIDQEIHELKKLLMK